MQPYFHRSLAAAWLVCAGIAIALLLWTSCTQLATTDAADDPFAVPTAKQAQEPAAGGVRVVVQRPDDRRLQMRSSCSRRGWKFVLQLTVEQQQKLATVVAGAMTHGTAANPAGIEP